MREHRFLLMFYQTFNSVGELRGQRFYGKMSCSFIEVIAETFCVIEKLIIQLLSKCYLCWHLQTQVCITILYCSS